MKLSLYSSNPNFVLGFHGCDQEVAEKVISGKQGLEWSKNDYDWLGHGIYFWENNPKRALTWAKESPRVKNPAVVGAIIDLKFCLSLLQQDHLEETKIAYTALQEAFYCDETPLPENKGGDDKYRRELDCAVIQSLHWTREHFEEEPYDSVRGLFPEGGELYPTAGIQEKNHIQLCIRNKDCIKGYFSPIGE